MKVAVLLENTTKRITFTQIAFSIMVLQLLIMAYFGYYAFDEWLTKGVLPGNDFFLFMGIGFVAQMIDGALGMAYGITCTTLLINFGIPINFASASVHASEVFTTGASGLSHIKFKNLDKKLFFQLVITGTLGAVAGAYLITGFFDPVIIKPYIAGYLLLLGVYIIYKGIANKAVSKKPVKGAPVLAFIGGLLDTIGGGGWGPIVTSNLLSQGKNPRTAIGTVNTAEFFITYAASIVFIICVGISHWQIIAGLVAGGIIAAPAGAFFASKINKRILFFLVGFLIILLSGYTLYKSVSPIM